MGSYDDPGREVYDDAGNGEGGGGVATVVKARLEGGPFDGDKGRISCDEPPPQLWAYDCGNPSCQYGSVHWCLDAIQGAKLGAEIYEHYDTDEDEGMEVYVHADPASEVDKLLESLPEPVPA